MISEVKLRVKESKISGKGVFAEQNIKRFQRIGFLSGKIQTLDEMIDSVDNEEQEGSDPLGIDDDIYLQLDELSRTFNHSCNPNSFIRGKNELIAMKDIKSGEEITWDYSTSMNDNKKRIEETGGELWTHECKCESETCRGIIDQFKTLPKKKREFYIKNKFAPDFILRASSV